LIPSEPWLFFHSKPGESLEHKFLLRSRLPPSPPLSSLLLAPFHTFVGSPSGKPGSLFLLPWPFDRLNTFFPFSSVFLSADLHLLPSIRCSSNLFRPPPNLRRIRFNPMPSSPPSPADPPLRSFTRTVGSSLSFSPSVFLFVPGALLYTSRNYGGLEGFLFSLGACRNCGPLS